MYNSDNLNITTAKSDFDKPTYKCGVCGKQYNTIEERMKCESQCLKAKKEEEALKKAMKENEGRINSEKQIHETLDKVDKMIKEHLDKYGSFGLNHSYYYLSYIFRKLTGGSKEVI